MNQGQLYIISAPSGAGKTSLVKKLVAELTGVSVSTSHTTRTMRLGETDGIDYFFVSIDKFKAMLEQDCFLEYAQVFDNFYGTAKETVNQQLSEGRDVILEIDWQGAQQIRKQRPDCLSIFIVPPSTDILQQRLSNRGQDDAQIIARRMRDAVTEMSHYPEYDYLLVNDNFELALNELKAIIVANRLILSRQKANQDGLLSALLNQ
ncbi:guanylate kinase [Methylosoma difficile]